MINGITDFDHVGNFYVSWISKKEKQKEFPFYYRAAKKFKTILMSLASPKREELQKILQSLEFSVSHTEGDSTNGANTFHVQSNVRS